MKVTYVSKDTIAALDALDIPDCDNGSVARKAPGVYVVVPFQGISAALSFADMCGYAGSILTVGRRREDK